jgi:hypothetical protein
MGWQVCWRSMILELRGNKSKDENNNFTTHILIVPVSAGSPEGDPAVDNARRNAGSSARDPAGTGW